MYESADAVSRPVRVWLRVAEDNATDGAAPLHTNGMGMLGMRERHGVSVEAWLPLQAPQPESILV
jgi:hypothetical protein